MLYYMTEICILKLPSAPLMNQKSFNIETIRNYHQDITDLKNKYHEKQWKYKNTNGKLLHASTGASFVGVISGISTTETAFTVVGIPISASLGVVSTVSTCFGGIPLLTPKKYKKKLLKYYELILDKITISLATFKALISVSLNDDSTIDAKEFQKLQTLYLQVMAEVRNVDRKMKVQTEENFGRNKKSRKRHGTKIVGLSFCVLFNSLYYKNNGE